MTDTHQNDERTVCCPIEGCDSTPLARGAHLHIRQSSGEGHGPQGEVPDHVDLDQLETAGEQTVEMEYPEERDTEDVARLCPYCSHPFSGTNGVLIHLGQVAGRKNHPEDAADQHSETDFPRVEVDEFENVIAVLDESPREPMADTGKGAVSRQRVYILIAELVAEGQMRTARRVRHALLGVDHAVAPSRDEPPYPDLFEAILTQARANQTSHRPTIALEGDRIMIACRGESALYTAQEAREVAERLEQIATAEGWDTGRVTELTDFLTYGADVLEGERTERDFRRKVGVWLE